MQQELFGTCRLLRSFVVAAAIAGLLWPLALAMSLRLAKADFLETIESVSLAPTCDAPACKWAKLRSVSRKQKASVQQGPEEGCTVFYRLASLFVPVLN